MMWKSYTGCVWCKKRMHKTFLLKVSMALSK